MPFTIAEIYVGQVTSGDAVLTGGRIETITPAPIAQTPTYNPPLTQAPIPMVIPDKFKTSNEPTTPTPTPIPTPTPTPVAPTSNLMTEIIARAKAGAKSDMDAQRTGEHYNDIDFLNKYKNDPMYTQLRQTYWDTYLGVLRGQISPYSVSAVSQIIPSISDKRQTAPITGSSFEAVLDAPPYVSPWDNDPEPDEPDPFLNPSQPRNPQKIVDYDIAKRIGKRSNWSSYAEYFKDWQTNADSVKYLSCFHSIIQAWEKSGLNDQLKGWYIVSKMEKDEPIEMMVPKTSTQNKTSMAMPKEIGVQETDKEVEIDVLDAITSNPDVWDFGNAVMSVISTLRGAYGFAKGVLQNTAGYVNADQLKQVQLLARKALGEVETAIAMPSQIFIPISETGEEIVDARTQIRKDAREFAVKKLEDIGSALKLCGTGIICDRGVPPPDYCGAEVVANSGAPCYTPLEWECLGCSESGC